MELLWSGLRIEREIAVPALGQHDQATNGKTDAESDPCRDGSEKRYHNRRFQLKINAGEFACFLPYILSFDFVQNEGIGPVLLR